MKDVREQFSVESNLVGNKVAMGIDQDSMAHIMNVLTDLYSNKQLAIIREYSTNAWDAHVEAHQQRIEDARSAVEAVEKIGADSSEATRALILAETAEMRPIEVTLPNALSAFLRIRDFGTGLTESDIREIYSQYGASTKRGSNAQNGMLGLGCKSALTYCSQFTVTSIKDGTKIIVNVGRDEDGGGTMTVLDPIPTDEAPGTEVMIPIGRYDIASVIDEARRFYRFWKAGTVLVNGKQPDRFTGLELTDSLFVLDGERDSLVVMGNVSYPAPALDGLVRGAAVVAFVPIGDVNFPPSREALMDTRTTRATIERIKAEFATSVKTAIQRDIDACATPQDAIQSLTKWTKYVGGNTKPSDYAYKGLALPTAFHLPSYIPDAVSYNQPQDARMRVASVDAYRQGDASFEFSIGVQSWPETVWVTGFVPEKFTAQHKRKLLKWCEANSLKTDRYGGDQAVSQFVMVPAGHAVSNRFIDPARVVAWEVVRKIKLETQSRGSAYGTSRIPGSYDLWTETGVQTGIPGDDIRQEHPVFYFQGNWREASHVNNAVQAYYGNYTIVCLSANRVGKFCRLLPTATLVTDAIKAKFTAWAAGVTVDQRTAMALDSNERDTLKLFDAGKLDDPALQDAIRIAKIDVSALRKARQGFQAYVPTSSLDIDWKSPLDEYPLFEYDYWRSPSAALLKTDPQHVYTYFNAAYAAR